MIYFSNMQHVTCFHGIGRFWIIDDNFEIDVLAIFFLLSVFVKQKFCKRKPYFLEICFKNTRCYTTRDGKSRSKFFLNGRNLVPNPNRTCRFSFHWPSSSNYKKIANSDKNTASRIFDSKNDENDHTFLKLLALKYHKKVL